MSDKLPAHVQGLKEYLCQPTERNEDLAIGYFRKLYASEFSRQSDAQLADGYVKGLFVLELKGDTNDWYSAFFQGLAYDNKGLDFSCVVVACKHFLAMWRVEDIPDDIKSDVLKSMNKSPSKVGKELASKYKKRQKSILDLAVWRHSAELFSPLFLSNSKLFFDAIDGFRQCLAQQRKIRQKITLKNFLDKLEVMKQYFEPKQPIKTVRAFYSMIFTDWDDSTTVFFHPKVDDIVTVSGTVSAIEVTNLVPAKRNAFKAFVESHKIQLHEDENVDDFFAHYDEAIDRVDPDFRRVHGIFFTDLDLSKLVMWFVKKHIPNLGKNYLVIDPACGSGNLVTNWRSPLELRHKVVSEIEPELLYAVEQRMKGDQWHNGKFTVVPRADENKGLNFIDKSAAEYLDILKDYLAEKALKPDKPIAFLCNPPYRSDDDQTTSSIQYEVHPTIQEVIGLDASSERYCGFLAQMKLICEQAKESGFPDDSVLLLFTKTSWMTKRPVFQKMRREMLSVFDSGGGVIINSREWFDVKGKFPVAFTIWFYKGKDAGLDSDRPIPLCDLSWLKKNELLQIDWTVSEEVESSCQSIVDDARSSIVPLGFDHERISAWSGQTMVDFKRTRRKDELNRSDIGGLPKGDHRRENVKAYGEATANVVGFMDDLTPCRTPKGKNGIPWFRLNTTFMDVRKNRLFSGPPTHFGYCANTKDEAIKTFVWYGLARTFAHCGYPLWVDNCEMWPLKDGVALNTGLKYSLALAYAENDCVSVEFPANNPVAGAPLVRVDNPMSPMYSQSFWNKELKPLFDSVNCASGTPKSLVDAVSELYMRWKKELRGRADVSVNFDKSYFIGNHTLFLDSGINQIRDYAIAQNSQSLLEQLEKIGVVLKLVKEEFYELLRSKTDLNYFGVPQQAQKSAVRPKLFVAKTKFQKVLEKRLCLASLIVDRLQDDENFGRTKFTKLFYLSDVSENLALETDYYREAAGPLDQRCLYNQQIGIEAMASRHGYFTTRQDGPAIRYRPGENLEELISAARTLFDPQTVEKVLRLIEICRPLETDQAEIIATLYACWNDFLLDRKQVTDDFLIQEFLKRWHPDKTQFSKARLQNALRWMRKEKLVPTGTGKHTSILFKDA